jgi:hypothetical protein
VPFLRTDAKRAEDEVQDDVDGDGADAGDE